METHSLCKACDSENLKEVISFGNMPVTNNYPTKEQLDRDGEYTYKMALGFCRDCSMVQLTEFVPYDKYIVPDETGSRQYAFYSSLSGAMQKHFASFAEELKTRFLSPGKIVADIGGNDGILLKNFGESYRALNIEPSSNVAEIARKSGIESVEEFFTPKLARQLVEKHGKFGAVTSANVILNIHDLNGVAEGVRIMLDDKGVFAMQDPYLGEILKDNAFDQIYDEHVWYFSLTSLSNLFSRHGMEIFDAELHPVHGGSMRVFMAKEGVFPKTERYLTTKREELERGMATLKPYQEFAQKSRKARDNLNSLLRGLKAQGKRIVGYAAASKGTIIANFAGIGPETLDYVVDSTPDKQGKLIPGVHIPIVSPESFKADNPDYALLGARNHAKEIMFKEQEFISKGGRFITPLPEAKILN